MATKTIAIVGITGNQGGSVAEVFLKESGWKVRGLTRDPTKASAKALADKGIEVVKGDLDDVDSLKAAFKGANVVFGNTDFWQFLVNPAIHEQAAKEGREPNYIAYDLELAQIKKLVDAVAANVDTLDRFVLSTLSDAKGISKGKITFNLHFDSKAAGAEYLKQTYPELAKKTSFLQLGTFASNWKQGMSVPAKQADGTFKLGIPMGGDRKVPMVDVNTDTGSCVKALVEQPAGKTVVAAGSYMSWNEWVEVWGKANGVKCTYERTDRKWMDENMGPFGRELADMFQYIDEFGYDGSDPNVEYPWDLSPPVKVKSMEQYIKEQDWSSILNPKA